MKQHDYQSSVAARITPQEAGDRISRVVEWWTKGIEGHCEKPGDRFTVRFGDTFVDFEVVELIPGRRIEWRVVDCNLHWISDKKEWKDTSVVWEISADDGATRVTMTHRGLLPEVECYKDCKVGWDFYVGESLRKLLTDNKGLPDGQRRKG